MNIGLKYSALMSLIEKNWKDETTNLTEAMLYIIRHFKFMEDTEKGKSVLHTTIFKPATAVPKKSCKNLKCIEKGQTTHYTNWC